MLVNKIPEKSQKFQIPHAYNAFDYLVKVFLCSNSILFAKRGILQKNLSFNGKFSFLKDFEAKICPKTVKLIFAKGQMEKNHPSYASRTR